MKTCHWGSWENFMLGEYLNVNTAYTEFPFEIWLTTVCISYNWSLQDSLLRPNELLSRSPSVATQTYCRTCRLDPRTSCCVSGWIKHTQMISHTDASQLACNFQYDATETPAEEMMAQRSSNGNAIDLTGYHLVPLCPVTSLRLHFFLCHGVTYISFTVPSAYNAKTQQNPAQCQVGLHK